MHVYTKTGDAGETGLYTGERVKKSSLRVDVYGTIDEADAAFGMARAFATKAEVKTAILGIQKKLSSLMADIASLDKGPLIHEEDVIALESAMDDIEERLPKLTSFLIPGDTPAGACLDHARTVVRRAERRFCELAEHEDVHGTDRRFLNRLSDYAVLLMRLEETDV